MKKLPVPTLISALFSFEIAQTASHFSVSMMILNQSIHLRITTSAFCKRIVNNIRPTLDDVPLHTPAPAGSANSHRAAKR
jgi:hypothetical protein